MQKLEYDLEEANQLLYRTVFRILYESPRLGSLLCFLPKRPLLGCESIGICLEKDTGKFSMVYDPEFIITNKKYLKDLIKHELYHLIFLHPLRILQKEYPDIYNIACDCSVNSYIKKENLPPGAIFAYQFNMDKYNSSDYYYDELLKLYKSNQEPNAPKDQSPKFNSNNLPGKEGGDQDEQKPPDIKSINHSWKSDLNDQVALENSLYQLFSQAEKNTVETYGNRRTESEAGDIHFALDQSLSYLKSRFSMSWQSKLKNYIGSYEKSSISYTWKKAHRRFPEYMPGTRKQSKLNVLIAVDSSGSIHNEDLQEFMLQIKNIGTNPMLNIFVAEFDTCIVRSWKYKGKLPENRCTGGGTNFDPALQFALTNKILKNKLDLIVYFTDGHSSEPYPSLVKKVKVPILWVLTPSGKPVLYWTKNIIKMKEKTFITGG